MSHALLQSRVEFNALLSRSFLLCYFCWYYNFTIRNIVVYLFILLIFNKIEENLILGTKLGFQVHESRNFQILIAPLKLAPWKFIYYYCNESNFKFSIIFILFFGRISLVSKTRMFFLVVSGGFGLFRGVPCLNLYLTDKCWI